MVGFFKGSITLLGILFRSLYQGLYGVYVLSRIKRPIVTIFGGSNVLAQDPYYQFAYDLGKALVNNDMAVLTGGGPGVMDAANRGAYDTAQQCGKKELCNVGIGVFGIDPHFNVHYEYFFRVSKFFLRKWLLMTYSKGFVILPGGIGTVDELFELLNELKHGHMQNRRIILVGSAYWQEMLEWYKKAIAQGYIIPEHHQFIAVVDTIEQVLTLIKS